MLLRLLFVLLALLPVPALAQSSAPPSPAGSWVLRIEGTAIFRFDIERDGASWRATWAKPRSFASDGNNFGRVSGPAVEVKSGAGRTMGEWAELTFPDPRPNAVDDVFRFRQLGPERLEMLYVDTGLAPFELVRVTRGAPIGPWEANKVYRRPVATVTAARPTTPAAPAIAVRPVPPASSVSAGGVPARPVPIAPTVRTGSASPAPAGPGQAVPASPPPPLSGRDAGSRIWSLPSTGAESAEPARPAMPSGR